MTKKKVVRRVKPPVYKGRVREFTLGIGLPSPESIIAEMEEMRDVLMGRVDPPLEKGVMTLMEVANGYFSRACEWEELIYTAIREGRLLGSLKREYSQLRTQEIRSFKELSKAATELGSRRVTWEQKRYEQETRGLEAI